LARFSNILASALDALAVVSTVVVVALTFFLVVARTINVSIVGLHEIILLCAVLMYMAGAVIASRRHEHIAVDWIETRFTTDRARLWHKLLVAVISAIITAFFIYWTYRMFAWGLKRPQVTPAYGIPLWLPQLSILLGSIGCFLFCLRDVALALTGLSRKEGRAP
jgi:TRAP-type C4-dicarboxylate transport system permease small subunit